MSDHIVQQLKHIITEKLGVGVSPHEISEDDDLLHDLGLNSMAIIEFISLIEEHFDFEFDMEELGIEQFKNLHVLKGLILRKSNIKY